MPSSRYHSLRTSQGTKRGIAPYWRKYRRGKKKGLECPLHDICLEISGNKKFLYSTCYQCVYLEGYPRALLTRGDFRYYTWEKRVKEGLDPDWIDADNKIQQKKKELELKKEE